MPGQERPFRVALQGELGSFSDEAIQQLWGSTAERLPYRDFADVTAAVASGVADRGLLPIENTIVGSINGSHDALSGMPGLYVTDETIVAVHHCLLVAPGIGFGTLRSVLSHPVALAQCGRFFAENPQLEVHAVYDTAGAAMDVSRICDPQVAAVASRRAAHHYGLDVVKADIEDRSDNQTRFVGISRQPQTLAPGVPARSMVSLRTEDRPGDLLRSLSALAQHNVNIRRLESRPTGDPWSYRFFIEFDHLSGDRSAAAAISEVQESATECRWLGTFTKWRPRKTP